MATIDRLRLAADKGRKVAAKLGKRLWTVAVFTETWSPAIGARGATLTGTTSVPLSPAPKVTKLNEQLTSFYGGGFVQGANARLFLPVYRVGPITLPYVAGGSSGGNDLPGLAPSSSTTQRSCLVLSGPDLEVLSPYGGEPFEIVSQSIDTSQSITLVVRRTQTEP